MFTILVRLCRKPTVHYSGETIFSTLLRHPCLIWDHVCVWDVVHMCAVTLRLLRYGRQGSPWRAAQIKMVKMKNILYQVYQG